MKGVIVQVGNPKSIVLFNNGRIKAINTPPNCHVGMIVTVKYSNLLKILFITLIALILISLGIFIGARYLNSPHDLDEIWPGRHMHGQRRRMMDRFR